MAISNRELYMWDRISWTLVTRGQVAVEQATYQYWKDQENRWAIAKNQSYHITSNRVLKSALIKELVCGY